MKKDEQPKTTRLYARASAAEKKTIQAKAKRAGLDVSDYLRRAALRQKIEERLPADFRKQLVVAGGHLSCLRDLAQAGKLTGLASQQLNQLLEQLTKALQ